ncbi:hypothetical protein [Marinobacterium aestuariivivens]|uniref:Uncharacterized protein n=1 Tax=Marinobacterium aestuariivivens TaxID=1698799 RepID=A0ABW1ZX31_9GAMM
MTEKDVTPSSDIVVMPCLLKKTVALSKSMWQAEKIILHGLFNSHIFYILAFQPWLLRKCSWVIWGGDLYIREAKIRDWRWKKMNCLDVGSSHV